MRSTNTTSPRFLYALIAGAALSGMGCSRVPKDHSGTPSVVIFLVDTLRADRLGAYGYGKATSPHFDALAEESVLFTEANAPAPWTLPSIVSLMVSSFLSEHGVVRDQDVIDPDVPTLAGRLKELGFATASIFENPYAGPMSGLDRGFDVCKQIKGHPGASDVEDWLDVAPPGPFFLYLHNAIPHDPYEPKAEFLAPFGEVDDDLVDKISKIQKSYRALTRGNRPGRRGGREDSSPQQAEHMRELESHTDAINALYDGEVLQVDHALGDVIQALKDGGAWDNTIFIVLSDHGEEMGEHGGWEHDHSVYEELVRVPFLIHFPGGAFGGARLDTPVSLIDVMPTLLDYLGASDAALACRGQSVMGLVRAAQGGDAEPQQPRVTTYRYNSKKFYLPFDQLRGDENLVIRQGSWKGIWNVGRDTFELYDLAQDRAETTNLASQEPERVAAMQAVAGEQRSVDAARRTSRAQTTPAQLTPEQREQLRALGYVDEGK